MFKGSIEYGCQIFRFNRNKTIFTKLEKLQYMLSYNMQLELPWDTSTLINVMLYEARKVPLKL